MSHLSARLPCRHGIASGALGVEHLFDVDRDLVHHAVQRPRVVHLDVCQVRQPAATTLISMLLFFVVDRSTMAAGRTTLSRHIGGNAEPDGEMLVEEPSSLVTIHDAGGRRDHYPFDGAGHPDEHLELHLMENSHAVFPGNLGTGTAVLCLDPGIGVEER